jgi:predicted unusual protein kinase regulating ubiquinone biosynthesis (AarF/ABC1/UbiB family)
MEFLEGEPLSSWLFKKPKLEERNQIANLLYEIFIKSLYELHKIHADPNPGNYLIDCDLKIKLLDFGSTKQLESDFLNSYSKLPQSIVRNDKKTYKELLINFGFFTTTKMKRIDEIIDHLFSFTKSVGELYQNETYDFSKNPNLFKDGDVLPLLGQL